MSGHIWRIHDSLKLGWKVYFLIVSRKTTTSVKDLLLRLSWYENSLGGLYERYVPRSELENIFQKTIK